MTMTSAPLSAARPAKSSIAVKVILTFDDSPLPISGNTIGGCGAIPQKTTLPTIIPPLTLFILAAPEVFMCFFCYNRKSLRIMLIKNVY